MLRYHFIVTTAPAATSELALGVRIVQEPTLTDVNGPISQDHADWMGWSSHFITTLNETRSFDTPSDQWVIRAKRRMEELGQRPALVVETVDGAVTVRVRYSMLLLLP